ncbi:hypothetical protein NDU88_002504 [Pleurodeles waltl]|uniref:Uncharacterized protein n=1 Tax=Pleurodeles waltl TaxID=8319 RepID=A0AAV7VZW5_PLEWA|nr:hypothetical protein NDU88_002504 [Pleurodeles waltl]
MMWCDQSQVLEVKAVVILSQEHKVTACVVILGKGDVWCITLSVPREDGFHGDAVRESSREPRWRAARGRGRRLVAVINNGDAIIDGWGIYAINSL